MEESMQSGAMQASMQAPMQAPMQATVEAPVDQGQAPVDQGFEQGSQQHTNPDDPYDTAHKSPFDESHDTYQEPAPELSAFDMATAPVTISDISYGELSGLNITVDPTHALILKGAGLDVTSVVSEYFSEDGLSNASLQALADKYGSDKVFNFLDQIQTKHQSMYDQHMTQIAEANAKQEALVFEAIGGEAGWDSIEQYAGENFSESDINAFNSVMESGNTAIQQLVLQGIMAQAKAGGGSGGLSLIDGDSAAQSSGVKHSVSAAEYQAAIVSGEYHKNRQAWDTARRNGHRRGI